MHGYYGQVTGEDGSFFFEIKEDDYDTPEGDYKIPVSTVNSTY